MRAAVLGSPITHSLSPVLHNAGYQALDLHHTYEASEVTEDSFGNFVSRIDEDWLGVSLTMPLKEIAFSVADHVAPTAQLTGAINTLVRAKSLVGYNTDVYGIVQACNEFGLARAKSCSIIGSGATARSAIAAAYELGITKIQMLARNSSAIARCDAICTELGITFQASDASDTNWMQSDLVINTTPAGVADAFANQLQATSSLLLDVVYNPWPTQLAKAWEQQGGVICPGYVMLLHQAAAQFELFTGLTPPVSQMRDAMMRELQSRS